MFEIYKKGKAPNLEDTFTRRLNIILRDHIVTIKGSRKPEISTIHTPYSTRALRMELSDLICEQIDRYRGSDPKTDLVLDMLQEDFRQS